MGEGINLAAVDNPEHAAIIDNFKDQLLLALVNKFGPKVSIPVAEVDAIGGYVMKLSVVNGVFNLVAEKKQ